VSTDRDVERIVRSWMDEGVTALPDRVLDLVLDQIPATPQRRAGWLARRFPIMNSNIVRFGVAAAVVVLAVFLGIRFIGPNVGTGPPEPTATPSPTPSPLAWPDSQGTELAAGRYLANAPSPAEARVTIDMPAGWIACGVGPNELAACADRASRAVQFLFVDNVVADPCDTSRALLYPPVGPTVEDLVAAISNLSGFEATAPVDVTSGDFAGKEFELTAPLQSACVLDDNGLGTWSVGDGTNGVGPGEVDLLRILDVGGVRLMIIAAYQPSASAKEIAEVRDIFDSIQIEP
jgi:hypothetical protein